MTNQELEQLALFCNAKNGQLQEAITQVERLASESIGSYELLYEELIKRGISQYAFTDEQGNQIVVQMPIQVKIEFTYTTSNYLGIFQNEF